MHGNLADGSVQKQAPNAWLWQLLHPFIPSAEGGGGGMPDSCQPGLVIAGLRLFLWLMPAPKPKMPFPNTPQWGRDTAKWGTGARDAARRASEITREEARALDRDTVRKVRDWYMGIYRNNPNNTAALERAKLMQRILDLQGNIDGRISQIIE
jgi:hypothetical protein